MADTDIEVTVERIEATALDMAMLASLVDDDAPEAPKPTARRRGRPPRQDRSGETPEQRTARKTEHQRQRRAAMAARSAELNSVLRDADTTRQALADAAMLLLQRGGPVADEIERMLGQVFKHEVGAPMSIRAECVNRSLTPKYLSYPEMTREERIRRIKLAML
ncbi:hypothetical protein Kim5_CH00797 [Rhizobium sp. Kim5]|uniref:hypothetical protein n=1 Tax=Rhizobium sp. Kim5 TaxID=2020311 RepID=UPI000A2A1664|nr:hypothetical protein [Rhizobium sp. Kim5]ARQ56905.1 hypothetical protein Kim5_CH00797 [Rhizobium sp. Kim5]